MPIIQAFSQISYNRNLTNLFVKSVLTDAQFIPLFVERYIPPWSVPAKIFDPLVAKHLIKPAYGPFV